MSSLFLPLRLFLLLLFLPKRVVFLSFIECFCCCLEWFVFVFSSVCLCVSSCGCFVLCRVVFFCFLVWFFVFDKTKNTRYNTKTLEKTNKHSIWRQASSCQPTKPFVRERSTDEKRAVQHPGRIENGVPGGPSGRGVRFSPPRWREDRPLKPG